MRQRHLWALVPAALAVFNMAVQLMITFYDDFGEGQYGTSYEVRWAVDLGIYLAYLSGLACIDFLRRRWVLIVLGVALALGATAAFGCLTLGYLNGDALGGGLLLLMGYFMNIILGLSLVALVVNQHHFAAMGRNAGPAGVKGPARLT